jgi:hypothetical protein
MAIHITSMFGLLGVLGIFREPHLIAFYLALFCFVYHFVCFKLVVVLLAFLLLMLLLLLLYFMA